MATRKLVIQVFDVVPRTTGITAPDYPSDLYAILDNTNSINERFMKLDRNEEAKEEYDEGEFISYFSMSTGFLFGSFVRLRPGEVADVRLPQLNKKSVSLNDMVRQAEEGSAGTIRGYAYFCMYKDILAMSSAYSNWRSLENHFNWLLREHDMSDAACDLNKKKKNTESTIPIGDIDGIMIREDNLQATVNNAYSNAILGLKKDILKRLLVDIKDSKAIKLEDILSATLHIKVKKRQLKKQEKALNALLRVTDSDNITIKGRHGRTIKGSEYEIKTTRAFEHTGRTYDEQGIETEMRSILKDVHNGKVVS